MREEIMWTFSADAKLSFGRVAEMSTERYNRMLEGDEEMKKKGRTTRIDGRCFFCVSTGGEHESHSPLGAVNVSIQ